MRAPKILILTEAKLKTGLGHFTRCFALYDEFSRLNIKAEIWVNVDTTTAKLFEQNSKIKLVDWIEKVNWLDNSLKNFPIVIVDSYLADGFLISKIAQNAQLPVFFDDTLRLPYERGIVLNGSIAAISLPYVNAPDLKYLLGEKYMVLRREFQDISPPVLKSKIKNMFLMFGSYDPLGLLSPTIITAHSVIPDAVINVVVGEGYNNKILENLQYSHLVIRQNIDANEMLNLMLNSDLAVSAGIQAIQELVRVGVPAIGVSIASNQIPTVNILQEKGAIIGIQAINNIHFNLEIEAGIRQLVDLSTREKLVGNMRGLIDGLGAGRVVKSILKEFYYRNEESIN